ncbi:hypothetical protein H6G17_14755 [Chroococcidiopsis sp. FACHB-1243]|uniref:hypothetical protein n=1 Tax=Chroococcidiopsis sp. [FACHB-1243] TaxID=2692781 RepID=UPI00177DB68B|nr:hypothetical protein [Chroococcidiopsis sp. [FACHB-1243]]MBD2306763.1 hypothetical protein [Chroococcidiopsis sp. [FACHB-1243]]
MLVAAGKHRTRCGIAGRSLARSFVLKIAIGSLLELDAALIRLTQSIPQTPAKSGA